MVQEIPVFFMQTATMVTQNSNTFFWCSMPSRVLDAALSSNIFSTEITGHSKSGSSTDYSFL